MFGSKREGENTAKEPFDVAGVIDTTPQGCLLSNIVDPDLVRFKISIHVSPRVPGELKTYAEGFLPPGALRVSEKWLLLLRSLRRGTVILLPKWWTGRRSS
jgi:hypothetical protein